MVEDKQPRAGHPHGFSFLLLLLFGIVCWLFWRDMTITWFAETFTLKLNAFLIPALIVVVLLLLGVEEGITKGRVLRFVGRILQNGYPSFSETLTELSLWHENNHRMIERLVKRYEDRGGKRKDLEGKTPFAKWMIGSVIPGYENNVQGLAYVGAAILIVIIGMRGIKWIPKDAPTLLLIGLWLEFGLLLLLGILTFYKPEEEKRPQVVVIRDGGISPEQLQILKKEILHDLKPEVTGAIDKVVESKFDNLKTQRPAVETT